MSVPPDWLRPDWRVAGIEAFMTTRDGDTGDARIAEASGVRPVFLRQVHGARVVRLGVDDTAIGAAVHDADASVTSEVGIACVVKVADCLPVLFAAPGGAAVGAAHAGWRGLAGGVLEATVAEVCRAAGCRPADLVAWLGACIGPAVFEVGADVLQAFGVDPDGDPASAPMQRFRPDGSDRPGKWFADLPGLGRDRLGAAGVARSSGGSWCTVTEASRFFSFRRERVCGRMVAAVWRSEAGSR